MSKGRRVKKNHRGEHPASLANLIPGGPGNQRARKHGAYSRYHPPEIIERITPEVSAPDRLEGLIQLEEARLHSVLQEKARWDAKSEYSELVHRDYTLTSIRSDSNSTVATRERPNFEQLIDRSMGRISALVSEKERLAATPAYVAGQVSQLLDKASNEGMTAAETAELFERAGIEATFSVKQRTRAELAFAEPAEPDGGMTDDELEALSAEYAEKAQAESDWLAERREEVQNIHDQKERERVGQ